MEPKVFIQRLFESAKQQGLTEYEAYFREGSSFRAGVFEGEIDNYDVNTSAGLSFRVLHNGKMGYAYTEAFDDDAITMLIDRALGNASVIETEDPEFIFKGSPSYAQIESFSDDLEKIGAAEKIEIVKKLETDAKAYSEAIKSVLYCTVVSGSGGIRLTNSRGLDLSYRSNYMAAYLMPLATDGDNTTTGFDMAVALKPGDIDFKALAGSAAQRALDKRGAASLPSCVCRILLFKEAASDLIESFAGVFSAEEAQKGKSRLAGREGSQIGAGILTLIDDPLLPGGYASMPFDDEGVATYTKPVVENGILMTLLHNLKTAAKAGLQSTGNAAKAGLAGAMHVSPSNFYIKPGEPSFDALMEKLGDGVFITELEGLHAGVDSISGDFSLSARGFRVEGGKKTTPVEQIVVSGNFYDLLENIEAIGNDLRFSMPSGGSIGSPSLIIKSINVAGE